MAANKERTKRLPRAHRSEAIFKELLGLLVQVNPPTSQVGSSEMRMAYGVLANYLRRRTERCAYRNFDVYALGMRTGEVLKREGVR
eukprot:709641-Pyramimonas_sp.AAC.1